MIIPPNAYELNKEYRQRQEAHSEQIRLVDAMQSQDKPSAWSSPNILGLLVFVSSSSILLGFFIWTFFVAA